MEFKIVELSLTLDWKEVFLFFDFEMELTLRFNYLFMWLTDFNHFIFINFLDFGKWVEYDLPDIAIYFWWGLLIKSKLLQKYLLSPLNLFCFVLFQLTTMCYGDHYLVRH